MAYNLTSLITRVQQRVKDNTVSASEITDYLNDTQRVVLNDIAFPFMEKIFDGDLETGCHTYELREDHQTMISLKIIDTENPQIARDITCHYQDFRDFDKCHPIPEAQDNACPYKWTIGPGGDESEREQIHFSAPVDKDYCMRAKYLQEVQTLVNSDDIPQIPEVFQEILILGAASRIFQRKDKDVQAAEMLNEQARQIRSMTNRLNRRQSGVPNKVNLSKRRVPRRRYGYR